MKRRSRGTRRSEPVTALLLVAVLVAAPFAMPPTAVAAAAPESVATAAGGACPTGGRWLAPGDDAVIPADRALATFADRAVVVLGENHHNADHHRWQLHTIAGLHAHRPHMVLGFEMFPRRVQPVLDRWVGGELDEKTFLEDVGWAAAWGFDADLYLPLFHFARLHRVPMIALNVERALISRVAAEGWESIPETEREGVSTPEPASEAYRRSLAKIYDTKRRHQAAAQAEASQAEAAQAEASQAEASQAEASQAEASQAEDVLEADAEPIARRDAEPAAPRGAEENGRRVDAVLALPDFARFVQAQLTWDRAMAERLAAAASEPGQPLVVGIIGRGHLEHRWGVPHQLASLGVADAAVLLPWPRAACTAVPDDVADAVFLLDAAEPSAEDEGPRLGAMIMSHPDGVQVARVIEGSVADAAGLLAGDVILSLGGSNVKSGEDLAGMVESQPPGASVSLIVRREGETLQLVARLPNPSATPE